MKDMKVQENGCSKGKLDPSRLFQLLTSLMLISDDLTFVLSVLLRLLHE